MKRRQKTTAERRYQARLRRRFRQWAFPKVPNPLTLEAYAARLAPRLRVSRRRLLARIEDRLAAVLPYGSDIPEHARAFLVKELRESASEIRRRLTRTADLLDARRIVNVTPPARKRLTP